ncbi:hypothetical protein [Catenibacterium sp.]|uniref:hypothetical protein n=1 Tax=Catenibacterium sp. TaxID=2049022 RepID=UPI0039945B33
MVHLNEMLDHKKSAILYGNNIPYFRDCPYYVDEFYLSGAAQTNRNSVEKEVVFEKENFLLRRNYV